MPWASTTMIANARCWAPSWMGAGRCSRLANCLCRTASVADRGDQPSILLVKAELQKMQSAVEAYELVSIVQNRCFTDFYTYVARLHDLHIRRKFYQLGQYLVKSGSCEEEDIADVQQKAAEDIGNLFRESPGGIFTLDDALESVHRIIDDNLAGTTALTGTPTGFHCLDEKGGLQKSDLIVIAGATSQGKTSFATDIAVNAMQQGAKIAIYSMEMMKEQLTARIVAGQSGVSSSDILYKPLTDGQFQAVDRAIIIIIPSNIYPLFPRFPFNYIFKNVFPFIVTFTNDKYVLIRSLTQIIPGIIKFAVFIRFSPIFCFLLVYCGIDDIRHCVNTLVTKLFSSFIGLT